MKKLLFTLIFTISYVQSDYLSHPEANALIDELVNEHGFDKNFVQEVLSNAEKKQKIIDSISKPAEFTWTWDRYKKLFIEEKRIKNGKLFINKNLKTLQRAEKDFGVPKEIITAIIGVETRYGKIQGSYRVIDSLLTLGFDYPRRSKFFREELVNFFLLTRENELDILDIKGSYAGAMGYGQFISSSYRAYAIDYDGDEKADLFNSVDDVIGSVANYLYVHGWKREGDIVYESFPNNVRKVFNPSSGLSKFIPLSFNEDGKDLNFIGDDNFIAITKYNISHFYAMAVYYLSEELKI
ncbi:MAG: lytic murein transglycosylase B [Proteobacteria bacterium]|jgi:membrane-bound lytic murein transglycosylase B|nr:lytic murein transglycosylase B [Pseudomonadota bacterium]MDA0949446.1 lytic murein transglycosylase B [Pseudomonadota bacterium]